ncbi:probable 2-oxoglutarate-dependent dioxygenase ANS isoform X1 [Neltuma alba]|uniref:probable 2-oxoglutarate-dependent dioxygenase ANS isoform X1 n=1 Tax=Neltuma alba TaxID=207710 RepID=UPI0010A55157|nr:probable 2-oxoglutarate-dependent dioxygenase ANS isoform X1 [Prosopis alba]
MSGNVVVSEGKSVGKSVQEMSMDGDEPPPQFVVKEHPFGSKQCNSSSESIHIPIIDVSLLLSSEQELLQLRSALASSGCFQAVGHGMSSSFLEKVREVAKQFFALPVEEKQKYARAVNESEGYGNDRIVSEKQVLDWCYRLTLRVFPEHKRRLAFWPENPADFRETLEEFSIKTKAMMDQLLRSMARSLNVEENSFLKQFGGDSAMMQARFNFYPPCSRPDMVLGVKPHTDRSGITALLQDAQVEGLQVLIHDTWINVPAIPDALVVNLGDQMQIMSNGIFKSPMHRVITNREKLRMSVAMFNEPDAEAEVGPVEALINGTRPRMYRNVKNYGVINYQCYQEGKVALETVRVAHN